MSSMVFIRGILGICPRCYGEISVEQHVRHVQPGALGIDYRINHPCGYRETRTLDRSEHSQVTNYLRQVAQGLREDGPALSSEEALMREFHTQLDMIQNDKQLIDALHRGKPEGSGS